MSVEIENYIKAKEDLERVSKDFNSSFMDVSVRMDRVDEFRIEAVKSLGEQALQKHLDEYINKVKS